MEYGTLHIVATPIGNLGDITLRAVETLKSVVVIYCEDTRVSRTLLARFGILTPVRTYHQHSGAGTQAEISDLLAAGKDIALVTDAGTPGVSDPGGELVASVIERCPGARVSPVPGPSALTAALSICGFPCERVTFCGFPPHKNKRKKFFEELRIIEHTIVLYESGYRVTDAIKNLAVIMPERRICLCRELTKKFETVYRGTIAEIANSSFPNKGEFVFVIR